MQKLVGPSLIMVATLAWSTAGLFTRIVSTDIPTTLFWRTFAGGSCVLLFQIVRTGMLRGGRIDWRDLVTFSRGEWWTALLSTAGMILYISSFYYTTIATVSFVYGTMPLVTCLMAALVLRTPITPVAMSAALISCLGVMMMVGGSPAGAGQIGLILAFVMTGFMAALTISAKYFPGTNPMKTSYLSAFLGAVATAPFAHFSGVSTHDYLWLALYGALNLGMGFSLYLIGVARVPAMLAALLSLGEIPLAPVWAWLLFGERVDIPTMIGGTLIVSAAVLYITLGSRPSRRAPAGAAE